AAAALVLVLRVLGGHVGVVFGLLGGLVGAVAGRVHLLLDPVAGGLGLLADLVAGLPGPLGDLVRGLLDLAGESIRHGGISSSRMGDAATTDCRGRWPGQGNKVQAACRGGFFARGQSMRGCEGEKMRPFLHYPGISPARTAFRYSAGGTRTRAIVCSRS